MMGGVSAAVAKTSAAPIERIKLLVQNQDEMVPPFPLYSRDLVFNAFSSPDQTGPSVSPVQGHHRLLLAHLQGRGFGFVVEG